MSNIVIRQKIKEMLRRYQNIILKVQGCEALLGCAYGKHLRQNSWHKITPPNF